MKQKILQSLVLVFLFLTIVGYRDYLKSGVKVDKKTAVKLKKRSACDNVSITGLSFSNYQNNSVTLSFTINGSEYINALNYGGYWNAVNQPQPYPFPSGPLSLSVRSITVSVPSNPSNNIIGGRIGVSCGCPDGSTVGAHGAQFNLPNATNYGYSYPEVMYY